MKNRLTHKQTKAPRTRSVDGFFVHSGSIGAGATRKKSRKSSVRSRAAGALTSAERRNIETMSNQKEGFWARNLPVATDDNAQAATDDAVFDIPMTRSSRDAPKGRSSIFKKKKSFRRRLASGFAVVAVAFVLAVGSVFAYAYMKSRSVFNGSGEGAAALSGNVDPSLLNGEGDGRINMLILGKGGPGHDAPDLTDTILLASIDPVQNEAALLSIPRDLYVEDENGFGTKINAIYANAKEASYASGNSSDIVAENAGLTAIKRKVTDVIGLPIHYYTMVNFQAFVDAIDTVGGLDIFIEEALYDQSVAWELGGNPLIADAGWQNLDGERALLYARSRKGSTRGDFDRTERQRDIIVALQQELLQAGTFANPTRVVGLLNTFGDNVRTDIGGVDELRSLYDIGSRINQNNIISVGLADDPVLVTTDIADGQSVVLPIEGYEQYQDIRRFVRNTIQDSFIRKENARIVILNGTPTPGLATEKQVELESYGYNVVRVENAPTSDYPSTRLIEVSGEDVQYTENYLERRLGVGSERSTIAGFPTAEEADFVIVLGLTESVE